MKKYWKKLNREEAGSYFVESDFTTDILRIYRINKNMWGYCYGNGMTKGTFLSLREAKNHFGIWKLKKIKWGEKST